jgi:hypothetical protein
VAVTCDVTGFLWRRPVQAPNSTDFVVPLRGCGRVPLCVLFFRAKYLRLIRSCNQFQPFGFFRQPEEMCPSSIRRP